MKKLVTSFCVLIARVFFWTVIVSIYLSGFIAIPAFFRYLEILDTDYMVDNAGFFVFAYLLFGIFLYYYIEGVRRRKTRDIKVLVVQDLALLKKRFKEFMRGVAALAKGVFIVICWLLAVGAIILMFVLFGWFIASLSATTIIIILLVLILLK